MWIFNMVNYNLPLGEGVWVGCVRVWGGQWYLKFGSEPNHYLSQCWLIVSRTIRTNFCEKWITIQDISVKKMHLKMASVCMGLKSSPPGQNGCHFPYDIFERNFMNENFFYFDSNFTEIFLNGPVNNILALVQIMAWRRSGDKPLSEPMPSQSTDTYHIRAWECWHFCYFLCWQYFWFSTCIC